MTAPVHAWMPSSPCGERCLPTDPAAVGRIRLALRALLAIAAFGLLPILVIVGLASPRMRRSITRFGARLLLAAVGIGLRVDDPRSDYERSRSDAGALLVAGHISWTDVLVLTAIRPSTFVARADLVEWPILGALARAMKVLPIDRASLRSLPGTVDRVAERLRAGGSVVVFPEATTWCGRAYGSLRPALFQAAVDSETWVQPLRLSYVDSAREFTTAPCFVGDETIGSSIARIMRLRGVVAEVEFATPQAPGTDRRDLAARCERSIRPVSVQPTGIVEPAVHGVDDPAGAPQVASAA